SPHTAEEPAAAEGHGDAHEPHESPPIMTFPLIVLAFLSLVGGVIDLPFANAHLDFLTRWLEPVFAPIKPIPPTSFSAAAALATAAFLIVLIGIAAAIRVYGKGLTEKGEDPFVERIGAVGPVLANAYYLDIGLARLVSGPVTAFASALSRDVDHGVIDGAVNG